MILITGANGFVGQAVARALLKTGHSVITTSRQLSPAVTLNDVASDFAPISYVVESIDGQTDWRNALLGVETVVHCAARVHIMSKSAANMLDAYRDVNVNGTLCLARQAVVAGVKRFVFLSTIGVNGNQSLTPFTESDVPNPQNAYSVSKLEAENGLFELAAQTGLEVVIIRPPLVYGPNAPGNFGKLVRWIKSGIPLPLGSLHNQRSLVALDNLVSLVVMCANRMISMSAANQLFLVADGEDVSITSLLRKVAIASGSTSRLVSVQPELLRLSASLLGKGAMAESLLSNLQVDATKARVLLGWQPVVTLDQGLEKIFPRFQL
jgi:nucleoside-diphosphate-sugar epimerase